MTCLKTRHGLVRQMNCSAIVQSMGRVAFGFAGNKTNFKIYETTFKTDRYLPNPFHLCKDLWKFENRIRCFLLHRRRTIRKNDWEKGRRGSRDRNIHEATFHVNLHVWLYLNSVVRRMELIEVNIFHFIRGDIQINAWRTYWLAGWLLSVQDENVSWIFEKKIKKKTVYANSVARWKTGFSTMTN